MRWLKRDIWKAGIALVGMLLLLVLMVWVPASAADAYKGASGLATPILGTVQATPTIDATVTELNKEKLAQEVQQLKNQNSPDLFSWLQTNAAVLLSTLVVVIGGLIGLFRWLGDRRDEQEKRREDQRSEQEKRAEEQKRWLEDRQAEREKQAEERFQAVVEGLGSEREEARIGAAITLRTFLRPGYEQFYIQCFDLAVAHLRLPRTSDPREDSHGALPLTTLRQALIVAFKEAFPLARSQHKGSPQSLDTTRIQLDNAYLEGADLKQAWMPDTSLRGTNLWGVDLSGANLRKANLSGADLWGANFNGAYLRKANLSGANLRKANLSNADLSATNLRGDHLSDANLSRVNLSRRGSRGESNLIPPDLSNANPEDAQTLEGTDLREVIGLTKEQLEACKAKGAIIDEDTTTSPPPSIVSPPAQSQSNDGQAPPATPAAQLNTPPPHTDGSNTPSSQQSTSAQAQAVPPVQESMPISDTEGSSAASS
jgi:uncharacterized protein YjbI with pentapeptide repeats